MTVTLAKAKTVIIVTSTTIAVDNNNNHNNEDEGMWQIDLPPQPAGDGYTLTITDGSTTIIQLVDVAFGDVYLCSGQSNMQLAVGGSFNATAETANAIQYPNIRLATVQLVTSDTPQLDVPSKTSSSSNSTWGRAGPTTVHGTDNFDVYSATCYYFGRSLYEAMHEKIPIGLVTSCWGGQRVETFSSPDALADTTCGGTVTTTISTMTAMHPPPHPMQRTATTAGSSLNDIMMPVDESLEFDWMHDHTNSKDGPQATQLWNAMIHPLLPMRFTGALWYQGESNSADPTSYACRFPAMITDWRTKFHLPNLSFFYVELAAYHPGTTWPEMRAAQSAALRLPKVGSVTAIDLGDPSSPNGAIHPRRKLEVGRRLSLQVRSMQYQERSGLVVSGPQLAGVQFSQSKDGCPCQNDSASCTSIRMSFVQGTADGLHPHSTPECRACCSKAPFQVLSDGTGKWLRVDAFSVDSNQEEIHLKSCQVHDVVGIRYAWEPYPECVVYNGVGGPDEHLGLAAAPFEWCLESSGKPKWSGQACQTHIDISSSALKRRR